MDEELDCKPVVTPTCKIEPDPLEPLEDKPNIDGREMQEIKVEVIKVENLKEEEVDVDNILDPAHTHKKRFSREESSILWREVLSHWDELFGQRSNLLPRVGRGSVWNEVAAAVQASSGVVRDGEEVRRKWCYFKNQLRAKLAVINASGEEEEKPGAGLSELEAEVAMKMKETTTGRDAGHEVDEMPQDHDKTCQAYNKRFSKDEEEILYKEVLRHWEELFGERHNLLPRGGRTAIWNRIAAKMNASSGSIVARDGEDVRKKWGHLKKQKLHAKAVQSGGLEPTGEHGRADGEDLSLLKQRIVSRMKQDAAEGRTGMGATSSWRFSKEEEDLLYTEILHHWEALFGERNQLLPRGSSVPVWTQVTAKLNAATTTPGARPRDVEEVRKKWNNLKNQLKAKLAPVWASDGRGGGGVGVQQQGSPQLTPLEERIARRMKMAIAGATGMPSDCSGMFPDDPLRTDEFHSDSSNTEHLLLDLQAPLSPPPSPPPSLPPLLPPSSATLQTLLSKQEEGNRLLTEALRVQTASLEVQRSCLTALQEVRAALVDLVEVQKAHHLEQDRKRKSAERLGAGRASLGPWHECHGTGEPEEAARVDAVQTLGWSVVTGSSTIFGSSSCTTVTPNPTSPPPAALHPTHSTAPAPPPPPSSSSPMLPQGSSLLLGAPQQQQPPSPTAAPLGPQAPGGAGPSAAVPPQAPGGAGPSAAVPPQAPGPSAAVPLQGQKKKRGRPLKTVGRASPSCEKKQKI
ncbi:uncharacterized protein LOC125297014 [Alosa alosa]|uniref:uncharacterized protein LOC125297014 n=1 Tax=Alosa alosa TaxID=278164 RepID=UPI00201522C8|nr:uncharacterized protein LOC125297014 [Alosa alosa]